MVVCTGDIETPVSWVDKSENGGRNASNSFKGIKTLASQLPSFLLSFLYNFSLCRCPQQNSPVLHCTSY
jgi:hypothetical protein